MNIWLIVWLIAQTSVRTYAQTNIWLIAQTNKQTKVRTHLQTVDWTFERSFVWTPECLGVVAFGIWASVQVERGLCLKRFLIVGHFPTFLQSCSTFPHFFLDENSTTIPDCYICGSRHPRLFSHWPPFQGLRTIIISVWIGTDIMNRPPLRTTFVQHSKWVPIPIFSLSVRMHKRAWQGMSYAAQNKICCTRPLPLHGAGISPKSKYPRWNLLLAIPYHKLNFIQKWNRTSKKPDGIQRLIRRYSDVR